jgi:hypothetical protein
MIARIVFVLTLLFAINCASTPCGDLANTIKYGESGQKVVDAVCACISFDLTASEICKAEALAFAFTDAQAKAAYAEFCTPTDGGAKLSSKLRTKDDFDAWFANHGAQRIAK